MASDPLCHFQRSSVLQKIRDPCRPKRMGRECIRQPGVFKILVKKLLQFVVHGDFRLLAAFFPEPDQRSLSGLEVVLDLEVHDRPDPRKSVGQSPKQSAIAKADFVARVNFIQNLLYLLSIEGRGFAFGARKLLGAEHQPNCRRWVKATLRRNAAFFQHSLTKRAL